MWSGRRNSRKCLRRCRKRACRLKRYKMQSSRPVWNRAEKYRMRNRRVRKYKMSSLRTTELRAKEE